MLQVGLVDEVLASRSVQLCVQCLTCTARCPRNIDIAGIFEDLKTIAALRDLDAGENAQVFNRLFLENVATVGRLSEAMFLLRYNAAIKRPLNDADLGLPMVTKGKLDSDTQEAKGADEVSSHLQEVPGEGREWRAVAVLPRVLAEALGRGVRHVGPRGDGGAWASSWRWCRTGPVADRRRRT